MLCDHCHKNEATIHMTNIINNQKTEQHLCSACATELQQAGKLSPYSSFMNDMWDNNFFTNDFFKNMVYPIRRPAPAARTIQLIALPILSSIYTSKDHTTSTRL